MAEQAMVEGVVIVCPLCGSWVMRASYEGVAEVNCRGSRRDSGKCGATLRVQFRAGAPTVAVIGSTKKA